jgi:hypothetical protein
VVALGSFTSCVLGVVVWSLQAYGARVRGCPMDLRRLGRAGRG